MTKSFFPSLKVLEAFFGVQAELEYAGIPVEKNNVEFNVELETGTAWFKLIGSQHRGELRLIGKPFSVVKLVLVDISRISVRKTKEDHYMQIHFAKGSADNLKLWLRPKVMLIWGNRVTGDEEPNHYVRPIASHENGA